MRGKFLDYFYRKYREQDEILHFLQNLKSIGGVKEVFTLYIACKRKQIEILDILFYKYEEGITITIDEEFSRNFRILGKILSTIEDDEYFAKTYSLSQGSKLLDELYINHDYLAHNWSALKSDSLAEIEEVKELFRIKDDDFVETKFIKGLFLELDEDIKRHLPKLEKLHGYTGKQGAYEVFFGNKRKIVITSPEPKNYSIYTIRLESQKFSIFSYIYENPEKEITIEDIRKLKDVTFKYKDFHNFLPKIGFKEVLQKTFFDVSKTTIKFHKKITTDDLPLRGVNQKDLEAYLHSTQKKH